VLKSDCLACAPFAINLVRKLALRRALVGNPVAFCSPDIRARGFFQFDPCG